MPTSLPASPSWAPSLLSSNKLLYAGMTDGLRTALGVSEEMCPPAWHAAVRALMRLPHAEQARFMTSPAKRKIIRAGRRGGKTVGVSMMATDGFPQGRVLCQKVCRDCLKD